MTSSSQLLIFGTLGALSAAASGGAVAQVDTSQWKCESCPFEKGATGTVEAGAGYVSESSPWYGNFTGLNSKGGYLLLGGNARYRDAEGNFGNLTADDLGLDSRAITAEVGREGLYSLRLGYDELPRYFSDSTSVTPFLGLGGSVLTLPAGFPAPTTGTMPLAGNLQNTDLAYKRTRTDLGATFLTESDWSFRVDARHVVREGTQGTAGSFFSTTSQLVAPLNQTTDEINASAIYTGRRWQLTLAYFGSLFRNADASLTWSNPFTTGAILGATTGQLALPPDNQFHQVRASLGYEFSPTVRATADLALGRGTQNASYLAATLNPTLTVPALPASSLQGNVATLNGSLGLTAAVTDRLRMSASLTRDQRDNQTPTATYTAVSTDMFVDQPNASHAYSFTQDRFKLSADYRGKDSLKISGGVLYDVRERNAQEAEVTHETSLFGRVSAQAMENLTLALKLAYGERRNTGYYAVPWIDPAENPLLRKYNMANRSQGLAGLRGDFTISEGVTLGIDVDGAIDNYSASSIGLTDGYRYGYGADLSVAISEKTRLQLFARGDVIHSEQAGSQAYANPDWTGQNTDSTTVLGLGLRHAAIAEKLDLGADLAYTATRSSVVVDTGASSPGFPTNTTAMTSLKFFATYRLQANWSLMGSYWYEHFSSQDWHLDGVQPATVPNLLAFGQQSPRYNVNVFRVAARYTF